MSHSARSFGQFMLDQLTKTGLILIACLASFALGVFAMGAVVAWTDLPLDPYIWQLIVMALVLGANFIIDISMDIYKEGFQIWPKPKAKRQAVRQAEKVEAQSGPVAGIDSCKPDTPSITRLFLLFLGALLKSSVHLACLVSLFLGTIMIWHPWDSEIPSAHLIAAVFVLAFCVGPLNTLGGRIYKRFLAELAILASSPKFKKVVPILANPVSEILKLLGIDYFSRGPKPEHCTQCGYNLHGLTEPRCPECGTPFEPKEQQEEPGRSR